MLFKTKNTIEKGKKYLLTKNGLINSNNEVIEPLNSFGDFFNVHINENFPVTIIDEHTINVITFVEVRGKSDYSMLDSMAQVKKIVEKAEVGIGIEDHGVAYATYEFNESMNKAGKKAINGAELYMLAGEKQYDHLVLIAKNLNGYRDISKLVSKASSRVTHEDTKSKIARPYNKFTDFKDIDPKNIIVLHGYSDSYINKQLTENNFENAKKYLNELKSTFGKDDTYLEIEFHNTEESYEINDKLLDLSQETNTKIVLTNDFHMIEPDDGDALEVLQAIGTKQRVGFNNWHLEGNNWHLHTSNEIEEWNIDNAYTDTTIEIYNKIESYSLYTKENFMPKFKLPEGFSTQNEYFEYLAKKGLNSRLKNNVPKEYEDRLNHEIDIIEKMEFPGYFLIVADFINYAKRNFSTYDAETAKRWNSFIQKNNFDLNPIAIGPGRGSAAGSLVAYAMSITEVDPLKYDLLFERFLNPERVSMPDIDTDIPDNKRAEIIEYVQDYYNAGETDALNSKVAGIAVFGTMKPKGVLKAVVRGLYADTSFGNKLANAVPDDLKVTMKDALESQDFMSVIDNDSRAQKVVDIATKLENVVANLSQHAAGYVIAPDKVINFLPTVFAYSDKTEQMEMLTSYTHVEDNGLLKMDFLGLKAMPIINDAIVSINNDYPEKNLTLKEILEKAPYDVNLYKHLKAGNTGDVFQLVSSGMTNVIVRSLADVDDSESSIEKAKSGNLFSRIIAGIAMYRPGPMAYIDDFVSNALHPENIEYAVPEMKETLSGSFGLLIYQESIMALLQTVSGFTLGGADVARRTIGKKRMEDLPALKNMFLNGNGDDIPGGLALGHKKEEMEQLWGDIETFAAYGFNKSHAAAYAMISISMAYLAYYYPAYFASSTLNHAQNTDKIMEFIKVYRERNIAINPASVNSSRSNFTVEGDSVRFGLAGIKMLASKAPAIVLERDKNGTFNDYYDFLSRMARNGEASLSKSSIEALVYSGALDIFVGSRKSKIDNLLKTSSLFSLLKKEPDIIFDHTNEQYFNMYMNFNNEEFEPLELLEKEHYYTGFYISGHPTEVYNEKTELVNNYNKISDLSAGNEVVSIVAVITSVRKIITKKNDVMAFIEIEDATGAIEGVVFPTTFSEYGRYVKEGLVALLSGVYNSENKLMVNSISSIDDQLPSRDIDHIQILLPDNPKIANQQLTLILKESEQNITDKNNATPLTYVFSGKEYSHKKGFGNKPLSLSFDVKTINYAKNIIGNKNFVIIWN